MKTFQSTGIIFRRIKYSETSLIVDIFTREKGIRSFIFSGVRKAKAKVSAVMIDHMNIVNIIAYDKDNDKLARVKEIHLEHGYRHITTDVVKSSLGIFLLEMTRDCIKEKEPNEELFDFITDWYKYLDICDHQLSCFHLMYLLELSRFLGFEPMNDFDEELRTQFDLLDGNFVNVSNTSKYLLPVERSIFVRQLLSADMKQLEHIRIPKVIRNEILKDIIKFYRLHVDNFREPKSLAVIQAILR